MKKPCIICGKTVIVTDTCEVASCTDDRCIAIVEDQITTNYQTPVISLACLQVNRNDFYLDMLAVYHR